MSLVLSKASSNMRKMPPLERPPFSFRHASHRLSTTLAAGKVWDFDAEDAGDSEEQPRQLSGSSDAVARQPQQLQHRQRTLSGTVGVLGSGDAGTSSDGGASGGSSAVAVGCSDPRAGGSSDAEPAGGNDLRAADAAAARGSDPRAAHTAAARGNDPRAADVDAAGGSDPRAADADAAGGSDPRAADADAAGAGPQQPCCPQQPLCPQQSQHRRRTARAIDAGCPAGGSNGGAYGGSKAVAAGGSKAAAAGGSKATAAGGSYAAAAAGAAGGNNAGGTTPLMVAASRGNRVMLAIVLENQNIEDKEAFVNLRDREGKTALFFAVSRGSVACAELLLQHGADVNLGSEDGYAPFIEAVYPDNANELGRLLLSYGADVHVKDIHGATALNHWIYKATLSDVSSVLELLFARNPDGHERGCEGETALHLAAYHNSTDAVIVLLDAGANLEAVDNRGKTALLYAASQKSHDAARLLLSRHANVHARDQSGRTAYMYAIHAEDMKGVKLLQQYGASS